ncbi:hypothetical protein EDB86DRAFT_2825272 [Lactarius hatsudake]|nr:hypothetical protein EDB86DRAFT_2825272 [Lactarius hatsudake]
MTGAMICTASNSVVELQSDLDILKGVARWAVQWRWEGDGQRSTRCEGALPGYEGLGILLQGKYGQRRTMGDGGNEQEERERESVVRARHHASEGHHTVLESWSCGAQQV